HFPATLTTYLSPLSLHDALPICTVSILIHLRTPNCSLFTVLCSLFTAPCLLLPLTFVRAGCSLFPVHCSLLPVPCSLLPVDFPPDRKSTRLNSSHVKSRMPSSA